MELTTKRINGKQMKVTPDGAYGTYQFGKWWLIKDLTSKQVIHKTHSLIEAKDYLLLKTGEIK